MRADVARRFRLGRGGVGAGLACFSGWTIATMLKLPDCAGVPPEVAVPSPLSVNVTPDRKPSVLRLLDLVAAVDAGVSALGRRRGPTRLRSSSPADVRPECCL